MEKIQKIEIMLVKCSWCNKFQKNDQWVTQDKLTEEERNLAEVPLSISHSICKECVKKFRQN